MGKIANSISTHVHAIPVMVKTCYLYILMWAVDQKPDIHSEWPNGKDIVRLHTGGISRKYTHG